MLTDEKPVDEYVAERNEFKKLTCPVCTGKTLIFSEVVYKIPVAGKLLIVSVYCEKCGYKSNSVIPFEIRKKSKEIVFKVEGTRDMYVKILRSPYASILIPELGVEINPGPAAEWYITNVEGLLCRIEEILRKAEILYSSRRNVSDIIKELKMIRNGEMKLTLIIKDPSGLSQILRSELGKK